jgi:putative transposase
VADITYVPIWEGWLFLAVVIDAFSRRCVGWSTRDDLKADLVVDALGMAVTRRRPAEGVVHHSDRGSQYASLAFGATLRDSGVLASMGSRGDAYDNAAAESFMATIKKELIYRNRYKSRNAARLAIFDYRTLLQPAAPTLDARSEEPDRLRAGCCQGRLMRG